MGEHARETTEPLWREAVGRQVRRERQARGRRISDVAERAGVSPQYLSEIERDSKDPSSEVLSAVAGALGLSVLELTRRATGNLVTSASALLTGVPARVAPRAPSRGLRASRPTGPVCLAA